MCYILEASLRTSVAWDFGWPLGGALDTEGLKTTDVLYV